MPADWINFINNVGSTLTNQSIEGSYDPDPPKPQINDFADYLVDQYILAISGKLQTPYGNTHIRGPEIAINSMKTAFSNAFKLLENERTPTFEEKEKLEEYSDVKEELPETNENSSYEKFELEFLAWAEKNTSSIPDFTYSMFFSQFPNFPTSKDNQVLEIARRIVKKFNGTRDYLEWIYSLKISDTNTNFYSEWTLPVYNKVVSIIREISGNDLSKTLTAADFQGLRNINVSNDVFQEEHANNPSKIPIFLTESFITKFTYDPERNSGYFKKVIKGLNQLTPNNDIEKSLSDNIPLNKLLKVSNLLDFLDEKLSAFPFFGRAILDRNRTQQSQSEVNKVFKDREDSKLLYYRIEARRYWVLRERYVREIAEEAQAEDTSQAASLTNDPYFIMANSVVNYWYSCPQPFAQVPPIPPTAIPTPGTYVPIFYGSKVLLAKSLRKAFNAGKRFRKDYEKGISSRVTASAIALAFALHFLQFKLLYNGAIPTPGGPAPMVGFVPLVF